MPELPSLQFATSSDDNHTPLPQIVAKRWNFPLAYVVDEDQIMYAIQDWVRGIAESDMMKVARIWSQIKNQTSISNRSLPYTATDGKTYQRDYTNDKGLYLIAQHLRVTKARLVLDEIKKYLAESGAFVDLVRREPKTVVTSGAIDADAAIDAGIEAYLAQGKDSRWIEARISGKMKRARFTAALTTAVRELLSRQHYATATDEIYLGLWQRTAAYLKEELNLPPKASLRDHQPTIALGYQGLAEDIAAQRLGDRDELSWEEARLIVRQVAQLIGKHAAETSLFLQTDLATGKPLLNAGL